MHGYRVPIPPVGIGGVLDSVGVDEILDGDDRLLADEPRLPVLERAVLLPAPAGRPLAIGKSAFVERVTRSTALVRDYAGLKKIRL